MKLQEELEADAKIFYCFQFPGVNGGLPYNYNCTEFWNNRNYEFSGFMKRK